MHIETSTQINPVRIRKETGDSRSVSHSTTQANTTPFKNTKSKSGQKDGLQGRYNSACGRVGQAARWGDGEKSTQPQGRESPASPLPSPQVLGIEEWMLQSSTLLRLLACRQDRFLAQTVLHVDFHRFHVRTFPYVQHMNISYILESRF